MGLSLRFNTLRSFGVSLRLGRSVGTSRTSDDEDVFRQRGTYRYFLPIQTRWQDNDALGHVNNTVYHVYFDTLINNYLLRHVKGLDSSMAGYIAANQCSFYSPLSYPEIPLAAMALERVGRSSVTYRLAMFKPLPNGRAMGLSYDALSDGCFSSSPLLTGFEPIACTTGKCTYICVDKATKRSTEIPEALIADLEQILMEPRIVRSS